MRMLIAALLLFVGISSAQTPSAALAAKAQAAQEALAQQRFADAAALYGELTEALPDVPGLRMNLGMALHMDGRDAEAIAPLRFAWNADKRLHPAGLFLGASLMRLERFEEAVEPLEGVASANPQMLDARRLLADAYVALERPAKAVSHLQRLVAAAPADTELITGLARIYEQMATAAFARLKETAPESSHMLALLGEIRVTQQQYPSAFYLYREALKRDAPPPGIHAELAEVYRRTGHADWAATEVERARAEAKPDCAAARAACQYLRGDLGAVLDVTAGAGDSESLYWRTRALNRLAAMTFARLRDLPASVETHVILAQHHAGRGQYPDAVDEWRAALALAPRDAALRKGLAEALYGVQDYVESLAVVDELLAEDGDNASLHWLRGDLLLALQDAERAAPALDRALVLDGSLTPARRSLGRALMDLGRDEEAIPHLEKALSIDEDGSVHFQLGRAYQTAGEPEKARQMLAEYQRVQSEQRALTAEREEEVRIVAPD